MKKLIAIVALTASVMATPAFAQSFDPDAGTGNVLVVQLRTGCPAEQQNCRPAERPRRFRHGSGDFLGCGYVQLGDLLT